MITTNTSWANAGNVLNPAVEAHATEMANQVRLNAAGFLEGKKEYFIGTFMLASPVHERALQLFVGQLPTLNGFTPDTTAEICEESWKDFATIGENENKREVEVLHNIIKVRQVVAQSAGRLIMAEASEWHVTAEEAPYPVCIPSQVQYLGLLSSTGADQV